MFYTAFWTREYGMSNLDASTRDPELVAQPNRFVQAWRSFRRWPVIPVGIVSVLVLVAIFAPLVAPNHPLEGDVADRNVPPAWSEGGRAKFLLGTDYIGRDILSRTIFGGRISLQVAATVLIAGAALGTLVGMVAGYAGGLVDEALMRLVDFVFAMPFIVVALVAAVVWSPSLALVIILLGAFHLGSVCASGARRDATDKDD